MEKPRLSMFAVVVDADGAAAFKAQLEQLVRHGAAVETQEPLGAGVACGLEIKSRDGVHRVLAEAAVVKQLPGDPSRLLVTPTRFGRVTSKAATAAPVPVPAPAPAPAATPPSSAEPQPEDYATAAQSGPTPGAAPGLTGADEQPELEPFESLGNYQVLKHLGGGGMAEVYLSRSLLAQGVDKLVAIKTARNAFGPQTRHGAMFLDEARVSATLQHPNLVQVFDFGEAAGRPYLAMEYLHGRDLVAALRVLRAANTPAPPAVAVAIGIGLCQALEYVHEKKDLDGRPLNLVHRDVGPANVLVTARSEVKLMDFGVASTELSATRDDKLMVGKLPYMPPEQMQGLAPSPGWDLYPVGVTLYQLLTLAHPYQGNPADYLSMPTLRFHRGLPSQANPAVPPSLDAVLMSATQLEAAERPQSARALREALEAAQKDTGPADVGAWLAGLFGETLAAEEAEFERLMAEARRRTASRVPAVLRPVVAPFEALRKKVVYSAAGRAVARRPWLRRALVVAVFAAAAVGASTGIWASRDRAARRESLARADAQVLAGRLVGPGDGDALDVLLAAQRRWPGDPRVARRLALLAAKLEALGATALERDNLEEAGAHLEAALRAAPGRPGAAAKLKDVEAAVRERSRDKVVQSQ